MEMGSAQITSLNPGCLHAVTTPLTWSFPSPSRPSRTPTTWAAWCPPTSSCFWWACGPSAARGAPCATSSFAWPAKTRTSYWPITGQDNNSTAEANKNNLGDCIQSSQEILSWWSMGGRRMRLWSLLNVKKNLSLDRKKNTVFNVLGFVFNCCIGFFCQCVKNVFFSHHSL